MSLTSPAGANLSADGTFRHPSHMEGDEASSVERMRKLLRAGERSSAFQPNWSILRLKERLESAARLTERERPPDMVPIGMGGANGGGEVEKPKKSKKKRPAEDEVGDKEKKSKKQKVEDGGGGGRGEKKKKQSAQGQGEVEKEKEKERDKDKPNKEKKKKKGLGPAGFSG